MTTEKFTYELRPCMTNGRKRGWTLVTISGNVITTFAVFTSLKAAKMMVAHLRKKPIKL